MVERAWRVRSLPSRRSASSARTPRRVGSAKGREGGIRGVHRYGTIRLNNLLV